MPEEATTIPETATETSSQSSDITGLPVNENPKPSNVSATVAEMMALRKMDKAKEALSDEDKQKDKKLDDVDKALREMLFRHKKKDTKNKELAPEELTDDTDDVVVDPPVEDPKPDPKPAKAKQPTKKVEVRDRVSEIRERELQLQRERLDLERERLELDKKRSKPEDKPATQESLPDLSLDERYELEVFNTMSTMDSGKYGNLPKRFSDVAKATASYKAKWEKDNPGEAFDPDDQAHDSFFESNKVEYDRKDFKRAEHKLATEGESDPKIEQLEKSNRELLAKQKFKDLEPSINTVWADRFTSMIEAIDPNIVEFAKKGAEKLLEEYPVEGEEILKAGEALNAVSIEAHRILEGDGLFEPDQSNRIHGKIIDIIRTQERLIPSKASDEQLDPDGRRFATWAQWSDMSAQEQQNHWHMGAWEVVDVVAMEFSDRVKKEIARIDKLAESRQKRVTGNKEAEKTVEKPPERRSPSASPGSASKTAVDTTSKSHAQADDKLTKIIRSSLFKRAS